MGSGGQNAARSRQQAERQVRLAANRLLLAACCARSGSVGARGRVRVAGCRGSRARPSAESGGNAPWATYGDEQGRPGLVNSRVRATGADAAYAVHFAWRKCRGAGDPCTRRILVTDRRVTLHLVRWHGAGPRNGTRCRAGPSCDLDGPVMPLTEYNAISQYSIVRSDHDMSR